MFVLWGLIIEWVWSRSMLSKCVWSRCQISIVKIRQHFTLFLWRKYGSTLPQMHHSTQNAILIKLLTWEYGSGDAPFLLWKFSRVSCLVCYGTLVGFCVCVYDAYQHGHTVMSRSPSKHQACWCMSHTQENQCHLVTCREGVRHPTTPIQRQSFVLVKS